MAILYNISGQNYLRKMGLSDPFLTYCSAQIKINEIFMKLNRFNRKAKGANQFV